jgi:uncharacterized protein (TIGR03067 family)
MTRRTLAVAAAVLMLLPAAMLHADDAGKGDKDLDGDWEIKSVLTGGQEPPADAPKPEATIAGDSLSLKIGDKTITAKIKVDPTKTPKTMDIIMEEGPHKGEAGKAIYEVKGDELRICHREPGQDRPTEFVSKEAGDTLVVWKRVKK